MGDDNVVHILGWIQDKVIEQVCHQHTQNNHVGRLLGKNLNGERLAIGKSVYDQYVRRECCDKLLRPHDISFSNSVICFANATQWLKDH